MYATWNVTRLKDELRKRKAALTGKKAVLIERLEAYDRNNLLGVDDELDDETPNIPALNTFRDVNASTHLPLLSKLHIQEFAERFQVPPKGKLLYESRSLVTLRVASDGNNFYFHAQCKAQMKKLLYVVILKLDKIGMIEESHCECAAGSGLEAHCKHIFTVLHGIEDMVRTKTIIMFQVSTERLMTFKQPKKIFYDSPMQSHLLPRKHRKLANVLFSPLKEEDMMDNYEDYVKNLAIGFAASSGSNMPYLQLTRPANPYAIENDHLYMEKSPQDLLLENLLLSNITQQQADDLQSRTVCQDKSKDWHMHRSIRITASKFYSVCHSKESTRPTIAHNILFPKKFSSRATTHGKVNEPVALEKYGKMLNKTINRCGLFISVIHPFLAASPDGLIENEILIEVKCPYVSRYHQITPNTVPYLYQCNGELKLKKTHEYYCQIQGQFFCTNYKYCHFVVYTFVDMKVIHIERDEIFINEIVQKLTSFYQEYLKPAILEKYLYKNYKS